MRFKYTVTKEIALEIATVSNIRPEIYVPTILSVFVDYIGTLF